MTSAPPDPGAFRRFLYPPDDERMLGLRGLDAYAYREAAKQDGFTGELIRGWQPLYPSEFQGVTNDGSLIDGLFNLGPAAPGEEAPTAAMVDAATAALALLTPEQRARFSYPVDAAEWQSWANPEFMQHDTGLRLEFLDQGTRDAILALVDASLSARGAELVRTAMRINGFLGDIVELPGIMNEFSYNAALYGTPSLTEPWGWQLFGHHVAVNCLVVGSQLVVSPVFLGAEPDRIDTDSGGGVAVFDGRIARARDLLRALSPEQRARAVVYDAMVDPGMPPGRIHPGDERHLAGAFQDNRVIPYEGVRVAELDPTARDAARALAAEFVNLLPAGPAAARMREIEQHFDDTWFSWIGGTGDDDVFYLRLQSPVIVLELDHHCGVFLNNTEPAPFHIHTVVRTPNGNDYGRALVRQSERNGAP